MFSILDTAYFPSISDVRHLFLYPYASFFVPFSGLWSPHLASLTQHLMLFALLFFSFVSIHSLLSEIDKIGKHKTEPLGIIVAALIYVFNVYAAIVIWRPFMPLILHYAFFPMFIAISIRYFSTNNKKYLLALLLLSWIIFPAYNILPSLVFDVLLITAVFISIRRLCRKTWVHLFLDLAKVWLGVLILSVPLILIILSKPSLLYTQYERTVNLDAELNALVNYNSPLMENAIFYSGYPPLYTSCFSWYISYTVHFEPFLVIYIGGLIGAGILTTITTAKNKVPHLIAFSILWLFFMFFFTGSNKPFPSIKLLIFEQRFMDMFRSIYARFGEYVILTSIPLIYAGLSKLFQTKALKPYRKITCLFLASLFLISSFPIFKGDFLKTQSSNTPSDQVKFPGSYLYLESLNDINAADFLYITIPSSANVKIRSWNNSTEGYIGPDIFPFILDGASIRDDKIRNNIISLILEGKLDQVQALLPLRYLIVTFDQQDVRSKETSRSYYTTFKNKFSPIYEDQHLAVFEFPDNAEQTTSTKHKQIFILNQENEKTKIAEGVFRNTHHTVIYENTPLEAQYYRDNYIAEVFDYMELNRVQVLSKVQLKSFTKDTILFPLFMVFPNVTECIYMAVKADPDRKLWNISTGFRSKGSMKWNYSPLCSSPSAELTFLADFTRNLLVVEDNLSATQFPMPENWMSIIRSRLNDSDNIVHMYGEIGAFATQNLSVVTEVNILQINIENSHHEPMPVLNETPQATIIDVSRIGQASWRVRLDATEPFILVLAETYDSSWVASTNGEKVSSVPIYGVINGFWINQTGQLEITIEYEPQKWFYYGSIISATTFLACLTYLTYNWTKNKVIWKRMKTTLEYYGAH